MNRPFVIGIAGGSGSGKTHLAHEIASRLGEESVLIISMDQYFWSTDDPTADGANINFDHPQHLDIHQIGKHIRLLQEGKNIYAPGYDYKTLNRTWASMPTKPRPVIIVEGLFVLTQPIVDFCDVTFFLDVASDERLLGRILRDTKERGLSTDEVIDRYQRFVRPSYEIFVAPTRQNADLVVDYTYHRTMFTNMLCATLQNYLNGGIEADDLKRSLRGEVSRSGNGQRNSYMPLMANIELLAKAFPEKVTPMDTSRNQLISPALANYSEDRSSQEPAIAI